VLGPSNIASWGVMLRLPDLQRELFRGITRPNEAGQGAGDRLGDEIRDHGALRANERLGIYARMYCARLVDALREDYPRLAALVGPEVFAAVAHDYVEARPSTHPSLRWFGAGLGDFIAERVDQRLPAYAADLACLEWARVGVFDAADVDILDVATLRRFPADAWPSLRLQLVPALEILQVGWPVHRIWEAAESGHADAWTPADTWLRVWRQGDQVFQATLDEVERRALAHVRAGDDFGTLCSGLALVVPEDTVAATAGGLVLRWIEDGALRADTGRR
jgi:hypothetical protein